MGYLEGDDRHQPCLLPPAIDEYVGRDAPVRVVDAFVDALDFRTLGFNRAAPASTGRPGYDLRDLLKLYIYGYLNEVRSSRRLEGECSRNVEVMWLVRRLVPDHKTVADFRRDNGSAIVDACRAFVLFCRDAGLFAAGLVSIDGAKFHAAASQNRVLDKRRIAEEIEKIDGCVAQYLAELDEGDAADSGDGDGSVADALTAQKARRAELNSLAAYLEQDDCSLVVDGELDARPMGFGRGGKPPSYNVQIAVDADTGIVVHHAVTDEVNDLRMLHPISKAVKDLLGREDLTVVADTGYSNGNAAAACERDNITACVPVKRSVNNRGAGDKFVGTDFVYDPVLDSFICPAGRTLSRAPRLHPQSVFYMSRDCRECTLQTRCTTARYRTVTRHVHEEALDRMTARVNATPELMRQRRCSAEHPFGTMKRMMSGRFLTRGIKGTSTEMALSALAFNMIRSINLRARPS
ncbi:IS1182 family transposase [Acidomonas methanolica]|uniref:IS1182 family transposase n=1 Tax=Acidomonas methanolica TaxID=437 RepID=UPI00211A05E3|nr:IS1182 family transposase [Acidomonas methanolica]MCQ9157144.1 IS1182 family transposase [Acidomonas methanolica]